MSTQQDWLKTKAAQQPENRAKIERAFDKSKTSAIPVSFPAKELNLTSQPSKEESKLNKTEKAYLSYLRMLKVPYLRIQFITLKIADDCRLTVDFTYLNEADGRMVFVDVKGFWREDAKIKIKVAARNYPEFVFVVAWKEKGGWRHDVISP